MKHLPYFITESLFDTDIVEKTISVSIIKDADSKFWQLLNITPDRAEVVLADWKDVDDVNNSKCIDLTSLEIQRGGAYIIKSIEIKHEFPVFDDKLSIAFDNLTIGNRDGRGPHPTPMTHGLYFDKIFCNTLSIDGFVSKLENFNFIIKNYSAHNKVGIGFADTIESFKNTTITFTNPEGWISCRSCIDFPQFKGLKTNACFLNIYDPSLFDRAKDKLDKFLGSGTLTSNGVVKKLNSRNLIAMANNVNKYPTTKPFKPKGKMIDLMDLSGFKDIEQINLSNNNVSITFAKIHTKNGDSAIFQHAKYIRLNNMKEFKDISPETIRQWIYDCATDDGWCMFVEKQYL